MQCRRESAVAQRGNVNEEAGTTTHKRAPIALRRGENRHLAGLTHTAQGGHAKKARSFREKTADKLQKTPNIRARTPGFSPPALRRTTKQRKHRTSTGGRALPNAGRAARSPGRDEPLRPAPPSRNETMGCRRTTEFTTKRPSPLESRKGRSGAALNGWQLTLRQHDQGRGQDLRSNSWRLSRRLVSRNS